MAGILLGACDDSAPSPLARGGEECRLLDEAIPLPIELIESSGVAFSESRQGLIWSHNDSGGDAELIGIDAQGRLASLVKVTGATNLDWEDIALGPCAEGRCLYIGDIGDNEYARSEIVVYVVPEPAARDSRTAPARPYRMRYPNGPRDSEAMFVSPEGELFIVTKGGESPIELYRYPGSLNEDRIATLQLVRALSATSVPLVDQVTAADGHGEWVVLRTYTSLLAYSEVSLSGTATPDPVRVDLRAIAEGQGEGVAIGTDGVVALTSEGLPPDLAGNLTLLRCSFLSAANQADG